MKKRILAALLVLLLLCVCSACNRTPSPDPGVAPTLPVEPLEPSEPEHVIPGEDGDGPTDADVHLLQKGYPLGYSILFVGKDGVSFDTANKQIVKAGTPKSYDFTAKLAQLYNEMCEYNLYGICAEGEADLTYKAFSGSDPQGENERYTITFTDNGKTYTVITDTAAFDSYAYLSGVGNLSTLVTSWSNLANALYA